MCIRDSYGMRIHPFYKTLQSHQGVDYTVPEGSSVFATADGVVKETATRNSTSGKTVVIDHGNGYQTYYGHNSSLVASLGQKVHKGQLIARMGSTGRSTGNHCHFGVKFNGTFVNPLNYL